METGTMATVSEILMAYMLYAMVLIRCSGIIIFAPFFGANQFSTRMRIALALLLALILYPAAKNSVVMPEVLGTPELALLALQELSIGVVIGFLASLVFIGAQLAGQLIGTQVGFSMANIVDPLSDQEVSIIGMLKMNVALMVFLILRLHLVIIWLLHESFVKIGVGTLAFEKFAIIVPRAAKYQAEEMFVVALKLAMPILVVMMMNSVIEGFVTRTMPQMNIMVLGLPLRVTLGLLLLVFVFPPVIGILEGVYGQMLDMLKDMVEALGASPATTA